MKKDKVKEIVAEEVFKYYRETNTIDNEKREYKDLPFAKKLHSEILAEMILAVVKNSNKRIKEIANEKNENE